MAKIIMANPQTLREFKGVQAFSMCAKPIRGHVNIWQLAPDWAMVAGYKAGTGDKRFAQYEALTEAQYTERYLNRVLGDHAAFWANFMQRLTQVETIAFLCYCAEGEFCHRRILAEMIREYAPGQHEIVVR